MKWIDYNTIVEAAKEGHIAAIKCSLDHWRQIALATQEELVQLERDDSMMFRSKGCSLCRRYYVGASKCDKQGRALGCTKCPLREKGTRCGCTGGGLWSQVNSARHDWFNHRGDYNQDVLWRQWLQKVQQLVDRLAKILQKAREKKKAVKHRTT